MLSTREAWARFIAEQGGKLTSAVVAVVVTLTLVTGPAAAARLSPGEPGGARLVATLTGPVEVPPGDPNGSGTAEFTLNPGLGVICYRITVSGIGTPIAAHIHVAPAGVAGPIVVPLLPPTSGSVQSCTNVNRDLVLAILKSPAAYYVNVHTPEFPAGAVRGQLSK